MKSFTLTLVTVVMWATSLIYLSHGGLWIRYSDKKKEFKKWRKHG